jgi:hypothetical protein
VPAVTPVKSSSRSIAQALILSVALVERSWMLPEPFCTPPAVPLLNAAVLTEMRTPSGTVPVALTGTEAQCWAPTPDAKLLVQFAMSLKFSE